jgi:hypothetical protein
MEQALCLTDTYHPFPLLPKTRPPFPIRQNITPIHMALTIDPFTSPPADIASLLQYIAPLFTLLIMLYMRASHFHRELPCFDLHSLGEHVREVFLGEVVIVGGLGTVIIRLDGVYGPEDGMGHWYAGEYCREVFRWWARGGINGELVESILGFVLAEGVGECIGCHNGVVGAARTGC